jgi:hypothetical protein
MDRREQELRLCRQLWPSGWIFREDGASGFGVRHAGYDIAAVFHSEHPYEPPHVYLTPKPSSSHYYVHAGERVPRLCFVRPEQWSPRMGLVIAVGSAMRFVNDYRAGHFATR